MKTTVKWLGHACVLIESGGKTIIFDPWIENPKFPGKEHLPEKLDLMLVTHGHFDHLGNSVELAKKYHPSIVVIAEMSDYFESVLGKSYEGKIVGMNFGGTYDFEGVKITMVPSSHSSGYNDNGTMIYMGSPGGYVVKLPDGNSFYHCGDTGVTMEMKITAELFEPMYGLLAIGGHYTMDPKGAAYAAKMMNLKAVIPIHWGTFVPPLNGTPDELIYHLEDSEVNVLKLEPGEYLDFEPSST